jgi:hypothetical protein
MSRQDQFLALPAQDVLQVALRYDPATGFLHWRERPAEMFPSRRAQKAWNNKCAGKEAFTAFSHGYKQGSFQGQRYPAHRLIWKMVTGEDPVVIDHVNGDRADNRWANLRATDFAGNQRNMRLYDGNTSGKPGVYFRKDTGKWSSYISEKSARVNLGTFVSFEDACLARANAERALGYHPNHGRAK